MREDFLRTLRFWADRGVDGFRVDVAMMLAKDMSEPYPSWERVSANLPAPLGPGGASSFAEGEHPLLDREELNAIYTGWREVFDAYEPPLFAVAETWVEPHRRTRYSNLDTLGQAFNFDLLWSPWDPEAFAKIVRENLALAQAAGPEPGSCRTTTSSATRPGTPAGVTALSFGQARCWSMRKQTEDSDEISAGWWLGTAGDLASGREVPAFGLRGRGKR